MQLAHPSQPWQDWLKLESSPVDIHGMEGPRQIDGVWWQQAGDVWHRWNAGEQRWERESLAPPGASPAEPQKAPVAAAVATIESREQADPKDPGETWATIKVSGEQLRQRTPESSWSPPAPAKSRAPLVAAAIMVLVIAVCFGAYVTYFKSKAPSDEEIDAAFGSPSGYSYEEWPSQAKNAAEEAISENADLRDLEVRFDGRAVMRDGSPLGVVFIIGMEPEELEGLDEDTLPTGIEMGPDISLNRVERAGFEMFEVRLPQGGATVFFDTEDGLVFTVATRDAASMQDISAQLAETNV
jgi:hypothetical protein